MIQDLHSHTYYSDCGRDDPHEIIDAALNGGVTHFGISDHNYGIGERLQEYVEEIKLLKKEYEGKIRLFCGIELSTLPAHLPKNGLDLSSFDYCLVEHIQHSDSVVKNIDNFAATIDCRVGIAHTDLFEYCYIKGYDPGVFFRKLAANDIFWEMNVNYDSIHNWRIHDYVSEFMINKQQQKLVRNSGLKISVGFDGHRVEDYAAERVVKMNEFLKENDFEIFEP